MKMFFTFSFPSRGANIGIIPRGSAGCKDERSEFVLYPRGFAPRVYIFLFSYGIIIINEIVQEIIPNIYFGA